MREILFRGKRTENGEWIYGDYCGIWKVACDGGELIYKHLIHRSNDEPLYMVDPETVGDYTGLKDKNGRRIFEGDIVWSQYRTLGVVEWDDEECSYLVNIGNNWQTMNYCKYQVVGNIHDNPELLEDEE